MKKKWYEQISIREYKKVLFAAINYLLLSLIFLFSIISLKYAEVTTSFAIYVAGLTIEMVLFYFIIKEVK